VTMRRLKVDRVETSEELLITLIGTFMTILGTFNFAVHLLNPTTLLGSIAFLFLGVYVLLSNSTKYQALVYKFVPVSMKAVVYERSLLNSLTDPSPFVKLVAFLVACCSFPDDDVHQLSEHLPRSFDTFRTPGILYAMPSMASDFLSRIKDSFQQCDSYQSCRSWEQIEPEDGNDDDTCCVVVSSNPSQGLDTSFYNSLPAVRAAAHPDPFLLKFVELSLRTVAKSTINSVKSLARTCVQRVLPTGNCDVHQIQRYMTTGVLGLVGSGLYFYCVDQSYAQQYWKYFYQNYAQRLLLKCNQLSLDYLQPATDILFRKLGRGLKYCVNAMLNNAGDIIVSVCDDCRRSSSSSSSSILNRIKVFDSSPEKWSLIWRNYISGICQHIWQNSVAAIMTTPVITPRLVATTGSARDFNNLFAGNATNRLPSLAIVGVGISAAAVVTTSCLSSILTSSSVAPQYFIPIEQQTIVPIYQTIESSSSSSSCRTSVTVHKSHIWEQQQPHDATVVTNTAESAPPTPTPRFTTNLIKILLHSRTFSPLQRILTNILTLSVDKQRPCGAFAAHVPTVGSCGCHRCCARHFIIVSYVAVLIVFSACGRGSRIPSTSKNRRFPWTIAVLYNRFMKDHGVNVTMRT